MKNFELTKNHQISRSETVVLAIDEDSNTILVFTKDGEEIGRIEFEETDDGCLYLTSMYLDKLGDKYIHKGLGRACLLFLKDTYSMPILASKNDGHRRNDGSHLTGDAPGFVHKMMNEGIIVSSEIN